MLLFDNINRLMDENGVSNKDLAEYISEKSGETVSRETVRRWRNGTNFPPIDKAQILAQYFELTLDQLMGLPIHTEQFIELPVVGAVNAGAFSIENEDQWEDDFRSVDLRFLKERNPKECALLQVVGDSMEPLVHAGEMVVVHRQNTAVNGDLIIAYDDVENGYTIKRFAQYRDEVKLIPANSKYKEYTYRRPHWDQLHIWGICLTAYRDLV